MTTLLGPVTQLGIALRMRAIVAAVATCPTSSTRSIVPVEKYGMITRKFDARMRGMA